MTPDHAVTHASDNPDESQERKDELGRILPQEPTLPTEEENERARRQGEESARTSQLISEGKLKPGDDPRKYETGVDKPHGGGNPGSVDQDAARRQLGVGGAAGLSGQPRGPRPNPNNPDDPTNPASTAHRGEAVLDGDARRAAYGGVQSGQVGMGNPAIAGSSGSGAARSTGPEQAAAEHERQRVNPAEQGQGDGSKDQQKDNESHG